MHINIYVRKLIESHRARNMDSNMKLTLSVFLLLSLSLVFGSSQPDTMKTYIVHLRNPSFTSQEQTSQTSDQDLSSWYQSFLPATNSDATSDARHPRMVHEYRHVATGFAARLTSAEAALMASKDGFVSATEQKIFSLHTTHSPNFLGLFSGLGLWNTSNLGQGVIVGVLDTGIWPDRASFNDEGVPPPPKKWKGKCNFNGTVCNNKLIGARDFTTEGDAPPFDLEGHGTHTSSTAAGNFVAGANVYGQAKGTAAGIAPYAHLAMYRVCGDAGCFEADILAALDAAVDDGVDVLSLSLGGGSAPFYADSIALGAFGAISKGVFVSCSAGNEGPDYFTLSNEAPWILTVGASTIDRKIMALAKLGDGQELEGESLFQTADLLPYPLLYDELCSPDSLAKLDVSGKVVACDRGGNIGRIDKGIAVKSAGGVGMILMNQKQDGFSTLADAHVLPATHVGFSAASKIKSYLNSSQNPMAGITFKGTVIGDKHAPVISSFSSRGPSIASTGILKPDIFGPGVSILAAWPVSVDNSTAVPPTATFNMISGTSMSCPHLAGVAALLKSAHPEWSPAAMKSAMMTTANVVNLAGKPILDEKASPADIFATGAGHINPPKANNPGLIYDIEPKDYIPYLCGLNYTDDQVSTITQKNVTCSEVTPIPEAQLNYPTFSIILGTESQYYTRTVTNVGEANTVYTLELDVPSWTGMSVNPSTLTFTEVNQKIEFSVEFLPESSHGDVPFSQGYLMWVSDKYTVRSQISVIFDS